MKSILRKIGYILDDIKDGIVVVLTVCFDITLVVVVVLTVLAIIKGLVWVLML